ncbi:MAG: M48 family metallopeptidase [Clostridia bacterium]|nr:M48 family metallopeptidase [Clostridia bacterium]
MKIIPDKIIRSKRKTLSITVDTSGKLIVRAPLRCSEARILAFIEKKSDWILKHQANRSVSKELFPGENLNEFKFLLQGTPCEIRYYDGKRLVFDESKAVLYLPKEKGAESVQKWLKARAKAIFTELAQNRAKQMGARFKSVRISSAKGRWGSCSADNTLRFTFRLLYAPYVVIEYVIIHELAHTFHKNYSKAFWSKVESYCPDWKTKRKWLKDHGYFMQIF